MKHMTPAEYVDLLRAGTKLDDEPEGLSLRVFQLYPHDTIEFAELADFAPRRAAWVSGPDAVKRLTQIPREEYFLEMGKRATWFAEKQQDGVGVLLAVFPAERAILATWAGLRTAVERWYGDVAPFIASHWDALERTPFAALLDAADMSRYGRKAVRENPTHEDHVSVARLAAGPRTAARARLFLWHTVGANPQFAGDGFGRTDDGRRTFREYLVENRALRAIRDAVVHPLNAHAAAKGAL